MSGHGPGQGGGQQGVPVWGRHHLGGAVRVLLEAQLEGLAHSADDAPGKAPAALQDVAGWGGWARYAASARLG